MKTAESEARKGLDRPFRVIKKAERCLHALDAVLRHTEQENFPDALHETAVNFLGAVVNFADEEGERLREKILYSGGFEPGRVKGGQRSM